MNNKGKGYAIPLLVILIGALIGGVIMYVGVTRLDWFAEKEDDYVPSEMKSVNRQLAITLNNKYSNVNGSGWAVIVYDEDGREDLESFVANSAGVATSGNRYYSGTKLVLDCRKGNNKIRVPITVEKMAEADINAVETNPIIVPIFTIPDGDVAVTIMDSEQNVYSSGGNLNKTVFGNSGSLTVFMTLPTIGEGFISSKDEINEVRDGVPMKWNVVLYCKLSGDGYEYISLSGWQNKYPKGLSEYFSETIPDASVSKKKIGEEWIYKGTAQVPFDITMTGYSGDAADLVFYLYAYSDAAYHEAQGSFGPDAYAIASTFTLNVVD